MTRTTNSLVTGFACLGVYFTLLLLKMLLIDDTSFFLRSKLTYWWEAGGVIVPIAIAFGYVLLQLLAGGYLNAFQLAKTGLVLCLVPFLLFGFRASLAYRGARAIGSIGVSTERSARVVGKNLSIGRTTTGSGPDRQLEYYDVFELIVAYQSPLASEWELPNGDVVMAETVPVSEQTYNEQEVGSYIPVVNIPGEPGNDLRLASDVRSSLRSIILEALFWLAAGFLGVAVARRPLLKLEHTAEKGETA